MCSTKIPQKKIKSNRSERGRKMENKEEKLTYTAQECANRLGISRALVYEMVKRNELPSIKCGDRVLIPVKALEKKLSGESEATAK
jgi:excisionase family DNA binding protein